MMEDEIKAVTSAWVQAAGTIISAVGSTPLNNLTEEFKTSLSIIGNVLQAVGSALMADTIEETTLEKIGLEIQAIGNITVVAAYTLTNDEETKTQLDMKGNLLQVLGGVAGIEEILDEKPSLIRQLNLSGTFLQAVGNSMQALAGGRELRGIDAENMNAAGSWIQAAGSVIQAIAVSKD